MRPILKISLVLGASAAFLSSLTAQTSVSTDPVGALTFEVPANSDAKLGVPLFRSSTFAGAVAEIDGSSIGFETTVGDLTSEGHFVVVTSGSAEGVWRSVLSTSGTEVVIDGTIPGLVVSDTVQIRPFWTLDTLFPEGGGVPKSSDAINPVGFVLMNDPSAEGVNLSASNVYFYYNGEGGPEGWYETGTFQSSGDVVISPETFITVRNRTESSADLVFAGDVPVADFVNEIVGRSGGRQDNLVPNPYPAGMTLDDSDLFSSGAVRGSEDALNPTDLVLMYDAEGEGFNLSPSKVYFYYNGSGGSEGWYETGTFTPSGSVEIPVGAAIVIRRGAGTDEVVEWSPSKPYTL